MISLFEQSLAVMALKHKLNNDEIKEIREANEILKQKIANDLYAGVFVIMMIEQAAGAYANKGV